MVIFDSFSLQFLYIKRKQEYSLELDKHKGAFFQKQNKASISLKMFPRLFLSAACAMTIYLRFLNVFNFSTSMKSYWLHLMYFKQIQNRAWHLFHKFCKRQFSALKQWLIKSDYCQGRGLMNKQLFEKLIHKKCHFLQKQLLQMTFIGVMNLLRKKD